MSDDESDNDIESDADKRAHRNAGEKQRRYHIRVCYNTLRDSLPNLQGGRVKASSPQILRGAADFIQSTRREISALEHDIDHLKGRNKAVEDQIRALEMANTTGNFAAAAAVIENIKQYNNANSKVPLGSYDSESEDSSKNNANSQVALGSYDPETESEDSSKNNANSKVALGSYDPETESEDSSKNNANSQVGLRSYDPEAESEDNFDDLKYNLRKRAKNKF